ncbi:MAG: DUF808 domain-containing protein [Beijerinckiaceae bacterium]
MSGGLLALLDDVAAIAKVAAASLDDVAAQAAKAGSKAAGIVIDDAAVTPRYVVGFAADRELPIIAKIAKGSLINKMVFLLPGCLLLNWLAPWLITPLLMIGGAYLCYEGYEKLHHMLFPSAHDHDAHAAVSSAEDAQALEDEKVAGAIRTDLILSAEIMAITLASVATASIAMQATVLAAVGIGITMLVYGAVAIIVKADDLGLYLAQRGGAISKPVGQLLVKGMPVLLKFLSIVGTAAMLWVGGGIIIHGLASYGLTGIEHFIHGVAKAVSSLTSVMTGFVSWFVDAAQAGVFGVAVGFVVDLGMRHGVSRFRSAPKPAH